MVSENGGSETFSYLLQQNMSFSGCAHDPGTTPDFQQVNVEHLMVMFTEGNTLRYAISNRVGPVGGKNRVITKAFNNKHIHMHTNTCMRRRMSKKLIILFINVHVNMTYYGTLFICLELNVSLCLFICICVC